MSKTCNCDIYEKLKKLTEGIDSKEFNLPVGYNSIDKIRGAMFLWVPVPIYDTVIWCKLACLNMVQIKSCGDLSCLQIDENKKELSLFEILEIKDIHEKIVKLSLITPSYDEIIKMIIDENFIISENLKSIEKMKNEIKDLPLTDEKKKILKEIEEKELFIKYLLPDSFTAFIVSWVLGIDKTNIKLLTKKMLLNAAIKASNGHNNPSDHLSGIFTDFQKDDIDRQAWIILNEFREEQREVEEAEKKGYQILKPRKKKAV